MSQAELDAKDQRVLEEHAEAAARGEPEAITAILTQTSEGRRRGYVPLPPELLLFGEPAPD